jgi:flagellar hook-associated protein 3 FlgL
MITRVTQGLATRELQETLARLQRGLLDKQQTVSTQKKLREASDDPSGAALANRLRADTSELDEHHQTIGFGTSVLGAEDAALGDAESVLTRAKEIATQQASGLSTTDERKAAAEEVAELERGLLSLGNTSIGGRYVFGGLVSGTRPFLQLDDPGFTPATAYVGPTQPFAIQATDDLTVRVTTPGDQVFNQSILALDNLRTTLQAGVAPTASVDEIETASETLRAERSSVGGRQTSLNTRDQQLSGALDRTKILIGNIEDADLTTAISDLVLQQNALQAALASSSVLKTSIVDYLTL